MKVVPHALYQHSGIEKILVDGNSSILFKEVSSSVPDKERYLSSHAFSLILEGTLRIVHDGIETIVQKNEMIFLPKGMYTLSDIIAKKGSFSVLIFFFDPVLIEKFQKNFEARYPDTDSDLLKISYGIQVRLYVENIMKLYRKKNNHGVTNTKLLELLHLIALTPQGTTLLSKLQGLKQRDRKDIETFMSEHFNKPLDIDDYAYLTGRSTSTFRRDFKSKFQISPKKWLIEKRLDTAAQLLEKDQESIREIALKIGYTNTSHFIKMFRKKYGISPKEYHTSSSI